MGHALTFSELRNELTMMVGWFLLSLADEHHFQHVPPHVTQQASSCVHLTLKEAEQWVFDVLNGTSQARQRLRQENGQKLAI